MSQSQKLPWVPHFGRCRSHCFCIISHDASSQVIKLHNMLLRKIRQCVIKLVAGYTMEISAEKHISKSHIEMEMHI